MSFGFNRFLGAGLLLLSAPSAWRLASLPLSTSLEQLGVSRIDAIAVWLPCLLGLALVSIPPEHIRDHNARLFTLLAAGCFVMVIGGVQVARTWSTDGGPHLLWLALGLLAMSAGIGHFLFHPMARVLSLAYGWLCIIAVAIALFAGNLLLTVVASTAVANPFAVPSNQATQVEIEVPTAPPPQPADVLAIISGLLIPISMIWFYNRPWVREEFGNT